MMWFGVAYNKKVRGRPTIEINPEDTCILDLVDVKISLSAAEVLDRI
ncbi:hypothetical protein ACFL0P_07245 [Candidatus Omnitrophota bacterium]